MCLMTLLLAFLLAIIWQTLGGFGWRTASSSDNWDDLGFLAGLGALAVTLFVATQVDSVTHRASDPDRVADRVILEWVTAATLFATAVEGWIVLFQGIFAHRLSLAPAVFLLWIIIVFSALPLVARPSPTASRLSLAKNERDQQRLNELRDHLEDPPRSVPPKKAWRRIITWGMSAGVAIAISFCTVYLAFINESSWRVLWLIPAVALFDGVLTWLVTDILCDSSVRRYIEGRSKRAASKVMVVGLAILVVLGVLQVHESTTRLPGVLAGVFVTALTALLFCGPLLLHVFVVRTSECFHSLQLAKTKFLLDQLQSSHQRLTAEQR